MRMVECEHCGKEIPVRVIWTPDGEFCDDKCHNKFLEEFEKKDCAGYDNCKKYNRNDLHCDDCDHYIPTESNSFSD